MAKVTYIIQLTTQLCCLVSFYKTDNIHSNVADVPTNVSHVSVSRTRSNATINVDTLWLRREDMHVYSTRCNCLRSGPLTATPTPFVKSLTHFALRERSMIHRSKHLLCNWYISVNEIKSTRKMPQLLDDAHILYNKPCTLKLDTYKI